MRVGKREKGKQGKERGCLVCKVPSIIGGGSFVQQRGQIVVGLSPPISLSFSHTHIRESTAKPGRREKKNKREVESFGKAFCGLCGVMMDHFHFL